MDAEEQRLDLGEKTELSSRLSVVEMSASVARLAKQTEHEAEVRTEKAAGLELEIDYGLIALEIEYELTAPVACGASFCS